MKATAFDFLRPADLGTAIQALGAREGAKLLAGGQSLGPMLNLRLARPALLVDISGLGELQGIADQGREWRIGGAVTHAALEDMAGRLPGAEMLCAVAGDIAYRAIRNRGTIGGSLAHADPAGDWPLALAALDARVELQGRDGTRSVAADRFVAGAFTTVLAEDEVVVAVQVTKLSPSARWGYYKFCRKTGEFPEASAAAVFDPERRMARVFLGALSGAPRAVPELASAVAQQGAPAVTREAALAAVAKAAPDLDPVQRGIHATTLHRALLQAVRP
jgi:aerobic carbon-monoxide dehydrogenase medium subunit